MVFGLGAPAAMAAGDAAPSYVLRGSAVDGGYELTIYIRDADALSGRVGLTFDTDKLSLDGPDDLSAFRLASGVSAATEVYPLSEMVSDEGGYACLAWYAGGVDATDEEKRIASLRFSYTNGTGADDIDSGSFGLRAIEQGDLGPWDSALMLSVRDVGAPTTYQYLVEGYRSCSIDFAYDGADRAPSNGKTVRIHCRTKLESKPVSGTLTLGARDYDTDAAGDIELALAPGEYVWRVEAEGYGVKRGKLAVDGDTDETIAFLDDGELVRQTADTLAITYAKGDSAKHVTQTVGLQTRTDDGVSIAWESSNTAVILRDGIVFLPDDKAADVTLTASLTKGKASATRKFQLHVLSRKDVAEENKKPGGDPSASEGGSDPSDPAKPQNGRFGDLTGFDWARDAIERLAAAGIIKGTGENAFSPAANIKRGDYIALLMRMIEPAGTPSMAFDDVPQDSYYFTEIAQARALGVVNGTGDGRFEPENPITRQDMMTMTARAIERTSFLSSSQNMGDLSAFADQADVSDYARASVRQMVGRGLIAGDDQKRLHPLAHATRAETAVLMDRIYRAHGDAQQ